MKIFTSQFTPNFLKQIKPSLKSLLSAVLIFTFFTGSFAQLTVLDPSASGISLVSNATYSVKWARGGTTFNRVKIKLSTDGGATYPYLLVNNTPSTATDSTENITVPGIITTQARIRITNQNDSTVGDFSDNDFAITGYCWPWNTSCTNNYISSIKLNTLNNVSTCATRAYINNVASGVRTTSLYRGPSYSFTIKTSKTNLNMGVGMWCDFNEDSDFDDAGEFLFGGSILDTSFTGSLSIPLSVTAGTKRLRVRTVKGTLLSASDYCTFYNSGGEIEDYTITIGAIISGGALTVKDPNAAGISVATNSLYTVKWSKGASTYDRVQIKLSTDGGATFPYLLVNNTLSIPTDTSEIVTLPGITTTQARIRISNQNDSTENDISDNDFTISGYCAPWAMSCTNNYISKFQINTLNKTSTCPTRAYINNPGSGASTTSLYRGPSYPFTIKTSKTNPNMAVAIWCDFNGDFDFDDAGEFLYSSPILDTSFSATIIIPNSVTAGKKRLRVRAINGSLLGAGDHCGFFASGGEIEDYTISIGAILVGGPLSVKQPNTTGISLPSGSSYTVKWSKGGTIYDKVQIKLSVDGGETFPYLLANNTSSIPTDTTEAIMVPGVITNQARIRVTNQADSTDGDISDNDFAITGYCWPWGISCTNDYISNFKINSLNRTSTCANSAYINNAASGANTTSLYRGPSYPFTIKTSKAHTNMGVGIWCDFNGDLDFDDADEFVYASSVLDTAFIGNIVIPNTVTPGAKRFRVRTVMGSLLGASDYCSFFANGEIEDYTVTIGAILTGGPLAVINPSASGISLISNSAYNVLWKKGGTSFDKVQIKLSADGGVTFPYLIVNNSPSIPTDTSESITVPGIITNQARIRIANQVDSTDGDISDNNFAITGYCWPWGMSCTNNYISKFKINTLSTVTTCGTRAYTNYTASGANTTTLYKGTVYPFNVNTNKTNTNMGIGIWCDLNGDLDFDDAGEFLYASSILDTAFAGSITIPNSTTTGTKRLRIRTLQGQLLGASDFCSFYTVGGEIEDYTITVGPTLVSSPLQVKNPSDTGISLSAGGSYTARWSKGSSLYDKVKIKLSVDGGATYPYLLVNNTPNIPTDTSEAFVVPAIPTTHGRIRVANQLDSTVGDFSDNDFKIVGYCWPWNTVCTGGYISNVTVNTSLNSTSTCSVRGFVNNANVTGKTTTMQRGLSYPFSVTTSSLMGIGIWCDFNGDLDFDDAGEFLYGSPATGTSFSGSITIPEVSDKGTHRFRVRAVSGTVLTANDACTFFNNASEIEDYTITISQPTMVITGPLGTQCAGSNLSVAFTTTGTFLPGNTFQVQVSGPDGTFAHIASVIGTGTSSPIACYLRLSSTPGTYKLRVVSSTPLPATFGTNSASFTIKAKPSDLVATSANRCGPGTLTLITSGCTTTKWYDAPDQGVQVGTGNSFTTPVLTESKIYYVTCTNVLGCQGNRTPVYATVNPLPAITSLSPTSGIVDFDVITVTGTGFASLDSVLFTGGKRGFITAYNATSITMKAPVGAVAGPITVYNKCGNVVSSETFTPIVPVIEQPIISLASGTYPTATSATLTCATAGADIYYSLDGNNPVAGAANTRKYNGTPVFIGVSLTLKVIGSRTGWVSSPIATASYTITTPTRSATPSITPPTGSYTGGQLVTMTCNTPGSSIYYTTNGQTPNPGVKYLGPFTRIDAFVPIKAVSVTDGFANSLVAVSNLTMSGGTSLSACSFSPLPGSYAGTQNVTITNPDGAASIYYTLDGTDPYIYSPLAKLYSTPVTINKSAVLKAQAYLPGFGDSPRTIGTYTIGPARAAVAGNSIYYTEDAESNKGELSVRKSELLDDLNRHSDPKIQVFPNPTSGTLFIEFGEEREDAQIQVINMLGQVIQIEKVDGFSTGKAIQIKANCPGFYVVRISDKLGNSTDKRIVLQ